jgi:hypothetical protein
MRFLVDVDHDETGRVTGTVSADGRAATAFDGWLELVRLLEGRTVSRDDAEDQPIGEQR